MYSNSDFIFDDFAVTRHNSNKFDSALVLSKIEKIWFLYKTEGEPKGISINSFCVNQGVPYNQCKRPISRLDGNLI